MPISRIKRNSFIELTDNEDFDKNSKISFKRKKKDKFLKNCKENISSDLTYENLSEEDKRKYNILIGKSKYFGYLGYGCIGIAMATAIYNGYDVLGEDFFNFSYGIMNGFYLMAAESFEYGFTNFLETIARTFTVIIPVCEVLSLSSKSDIYSALANRLVKTHKEGLTEKFVNKMADRYANKKELKERNALINPYDEPEEVAVSTCLFEDTNAK